MARWGAAMSLWHPLWAPPSAAELRAGARLLGDIEQLAATPRERGYLRAAAAFFADDDVSRDRTRRAAFSEQMRALYEAEPADAEAAAFYALSLLAVADPQDKSYANQYRAGAILFWLRESQPRHPGVLHYLIHSFDFPGLAHLALGAALTYADAAPDSAHAQHMPSHIFTRLGLWERSLASNHDSTASAADYTERADLEPTVQGYLREEMQVQEQMLGAWIAAADGRIDEAPVAARAAADREDAVDKHPVTPGEVLPARELYADLLLEARRFDDALAAYLQVLAGAPNRFNALLGAARAAKGAGRTAAAEHHYGRLVEIAAAGSPDRAGLVEARRFLP